MTQILRIEYDSLVMIGEGFLREATELDQFVQHLICDVDELYQKGWTGAAADRFFVGMQQAIPATQKLISLLNSVADALPDICQLFYDADLQVVELFRRVQADQTSPFAIAKELVAWAGPLTSFLSTGLSELQGELAKSQQIKLPGERIDAIMGSHITLMTIGDPNTLPGAARIATWGIAQGWSDQEAALAAQTVEELPAALRDRAEFSTMLRVKGWPVTSEYDPGKQMITISDDAYSADVQTHLGVNQDQAFQALVLHEITHSAIDGDLEQSYALQTGWVMSYGDWRYAGSPADLPGANGPGPMIEMPNPHEDLAQAVTFYRYAPERFARNSPARYAWVRDNIYGGKEFK